MFLTLVCLGFMLWWGGLFAWSFWKCQGTPWQCFLKAGQDSATIAIAQMSYVVVALMHFVGAIAVVLSGDPSLGDKIQAYVPTKATAVTALIIVVLVILGRLRTLAKELM